MIALLLLLVFSKPLLAKNLEVITAQKKVSLSLQELKTKLKSHSVKINDPIYQSGKEFDGFLLKDVLELAGVDFSTQADEVIFGTIDGYAPNVTFAKIKTHRAYVTYQEHGTPGKFALVSQGKTKISPLPFYLVWEEGNALAGVPWPYQLVRLEVVDWKQKYPHVFPEAAAEGSAVMNGFALFKAECIRCHSMNLEGGDVGPELNAPLNITEYWSAENLRAYIQDNSKFRYKSKMPQFTKFTTQQLDELLAYLLAMKGQKIKNP